MNNSNCRKADFTVNNYDVFEYQEGELFIQTDFEGGEEIPRYAQIKINNGRVYLRIVDLERLLEFARSIPRDEMTDGQ